MEDNGLLEEFIYEASELLDEAEESLLAIEKEENLQESYNSVFRVFHSLKGSAGMIGFEVVQKHMHLVEDRFEQYSEKLSELSGVATFFLDSVDHCRLLLDGQVAEFNYSIQAEFNKENPTAKVDIKATVQLKRNEVFIVDILSPEIREEEVFKNLTSHVQFNLIEDLNTYFKKRQYFYSSALVLKGSDYEEIKGRVKDDVPFILYGSTDKLDSNILLDNIQEQLPEYVLSAFSHSKLMMRSLLLIEKSIKFIFYQYNDLEQYLLKDNRTAARESIKEEVQNIITSRGELFK